MPDGNVFTKITNEYYQLTTAERKVADFIAKNREKTQHMSISELAERCGVAEATISRFCRRMRYKGYNAFKLAVANSTAVRGGDNPLSGEVTPEDSIQHLCQKLYTANAEAVRETMELLDYDNVRLAADILECATKVLCMGQGGSMVLAMEAAHLFSTVKPNFVPVCDSHLQAIAASQLSAGDVVLYFSYSGSTKDLQDLLKVTRRQGAKVLLITRFPKSPAASKADVVLQCGAKEGPFQLGSVAARMAQLYLVDVLFSEVCRRDMDGCRARRERVAQALSDKHIQQNLSVSQQG